MKIAIIGGGIAGLTQGIFLKQKGFDVVVYERTANINNRGHAFLMNEEGLEQFDKYTVDDKKIDAKLPSRKVDLFSLKNPNEDEFIKISLDGWHCIKREDFINYLTSFYATNEIKYNYEFSHFVRSENKVNEVAFKNGEKVLADLFIGADGGNSQIRQSLFGETKYTPIEVKEIVGISKINFQSDYNVFQKYQASNKGLGFGFIPAANNECVWFMQYDVQLEKDFLIDGQIDIKSLCFTLLKDFPNQVHDVLAGNDFSTSYIWNTRDFDLLNSFHKQNVVLIGDSAHLSLPFTSAGTTNAIKDAAVLTEILINETNLEKALNIYYNSRKDSLKKQIELGRALKKNFLTAETGNERKFLIPLVSDKFENKTLKKVKPLKILYFTDPICSTCWIFQPILRKLKLNYDSHVDIEYRMGGLLNNWEDYKNEKITSPLDAAMLWNDMREKHDVPMIGDVWIEDPLKSSYPASIAFKAAQLQDSDKAISFLRRMKEMLFIEKKNINNWINIEPAALFSGLDSALLKQQINASALTHFEEDLEMAKRFDVKVFPTLLFEVDSKIVYTLKGLQSYEMIESIIQTYCPTICRNEFLPNDDELFQLFNTMTAKEFSFLKNIELDESNKRLDILQKKGIITNKKIVNVEYWRLV
jgi:2-polyprenyl-6-methoxyphenol hydroxylase-like FAD-dependent oxidoreductase/predicted DsbA family dithiol-disulfide isomerase